MKEISFSVDSKALISIGMNKLPTPRKNTLVNAFNF